MTSHDTYKKQIKACILQISRTRTGWTSINSRVEVRELVKAISDRERTEDLVRRCIHELVADEAPLEYIGNDNTVVRVTDLEEAKERMKDLRREVFYLCKED